MSGIVGIVSRHGAPVDERRLRRMTAFLAYRGPDGRNVWLGGPVGFGHTLLRTTCEPRDDEPTGQPGRPGMDYSGRARGWPGGSRHLLESRGRVGLRSASDAQLILHAYHAWADECVDYLLGDFAFAIWDARTTSSFLRSRPFRRQAVLLRAGPGRLHLQQHPGLRPPASGRWRLVERACHRGLSALRLQRRADDHHVYGCAAPRTGA